MNDMLEELSAYGEGSFGPPGSSLPLPKLTVTPNGAGQNFQLYYEESTVTVLTCVLSSCDQATVRDGRPSWVFDFEPVPFSVLCLPVENPGQSP